ncbi:MAG: hypothetical protein AAGG51_07335 [Cyanobacteria bacterium P01_G01_bin.54]
MPWLPISNPEGLTLYSIQELGISEITCEIRDESSFSTGYISLFENSSEQNYSIPILWFYHYYDECIAEPPSLSGYSSPETNPPVNTSGTFKKPSVGGREFDLYDFINSFSSYYSISQSSISREL